MQPLFVCIAITLLVLNSTHATPPLGYNLVFDEEFNGPLSISAYGPGTKWIAHTPYGGDFGSAWFCNPTDPTPPSTVSNGILTIKAWFDPVSNHWRSGLLSSVDTNGNGFSQALGYWECRMQLPPGAGVWPAFWLDGLGSFKNPKTNVAEVDILEAYGVNINVAHQNVHIWNPQGRKISGSGNSYTMQTSPTGNYRVYSCLITPQFITFAIDSQMVWETPTPPEATEPLYVMVDLALGGGWPIDQTPNPSFLHVDYIRAYAPPGSVFQAPVIHH
jgi:beta-glucanase (GH16 family)